MNRLSGSARVYIPVEDIIAGITADMDSPLSNLCRSYMGFPLTLKAEQRESLLAEIRFCGSNVIRCVCVALLEQRQN